MVESLYKYTQPLFGTPEPLPETGVLANQKYWFHAPLTAMLPTHAAETAGTHDPFLEVAQQPKNENNPCSAHSGLYHQQCWSLAEHCHT